MSAIITDIGHTEIVRKLLNTDSIWVGIGKTTAWADENNPPAPDPSTTEISEVVGYKKVLDKYLVVEDPTNGTIDFGSTKYRPVNESDYFTEKPHFLYLKFEIIGDELPLVTYRQIGIVFDLVPDTGYEAYTVLTSDQVSDTGYLLTLDNRTPVTRYSDTKDVFEYIIRG